MENTNLEVNTTKLGSWRVSIIITAIVAILIFAYVYLQFSTKVEISKSSYERNVALAAFSAVDANLNGVFREIDCTGNEKFGVTCKTITSEVIKFRTSTPMPEFRLHIARDGDNLDIRKISGLNWQAQSMSNEDIFNVFKSPDFRK